MSLPKFLFFVIEKDGRSRQIVNGVVTSLTSPKPLPNAPDNSQEIHLGWERSPTYHGNIRNFSLPLGFVRDGRKILQNDFYKFNSDRELYLLVKQLTHEWTDTTFKEYYKQLYKGQLDFSTGEDAQGDYRFNIQIMEGGLHRLLKANESTQFDLPFDLDAKNIRMDGMFIEGTFRWIIPEGGSDGFPFMSLLPHDSPVPGIAVFDVDKYYDQLAITDKDSISYFASASQNIDDVVLTGTIVNLNEDSGFIVMELIIFNTISDSTRLTIDLAPGNPYPPGSTIQINQTIDLLEGDRLFFRLADINITQITFAESNLQLNVKSKPLASTIKGFTLYDTGRKLTEKITGNADDFDSTLLADLITEFGSEIILTSGDGVRGITNATLKTSWRDYYKFVDVVLMSQMTITDKIRIYNRLTAYDNTQAAIALGNIKDLKITKAVDQMFTSVKFGHAEQQVDDTNGKFDFNGFMIFSTPIKSIPDKQLDLQSPYKTSPYEIEQTRANYEGKTTTDKETDNDVFAIAVQPDAESDTFDTTGSFFADGDPLAPGQPLISITAGNPEIVAGMKIRITGTASNDGDYTVASATGWFFGQLIVTDQALTDESSVNFNIEILEGQIYELDRTIAITQLTDPDVSTEIKESVFNVRLSPKRVLLRHSAWLAGGLHNYAPGALTFSSANRNKEMIAGGITEKADVPIANLGDPMYLPFYFEFDTISPIDMVATLDANPNPVFSFEWNGSTYKGFFIRGGIALNDREEQTFKLLCTPDTDLLNLVS